MFYTFCLPPNVSQNKKTRGFPGVQRKDTIFQESPRLSKENLNFQGFYRNSRGKRNPASKIHRMVLQCKRYWKSIDMKLHIS